MLDMVYVVPCVLKERTMKPVGESFGFATLITVFLPRLTLAMGVLFILQSDPGWMERQKAVLPLFTELKEWQQTFAALAIISLLGSLIAAVNGLLESFIYDRITRQRLKIEMGHYNDHWHEYLYRVSKEANSYVSRVVIWFLFESRMAVAVAVALVFAFYLIEAEDRELSVAVLFVSAFLALGFLGYHHHKELAEYRRVAYWYWKSLRDAEVRKAQTT